jgi:glutaredoxin
MDNQIAIFIVCALIIGIFVGYMFFNIASGSFLTKNETTMCNLGGKGYDIQKLKENVTKYIDENFLSMYGVKSKIANYTEYENIIAFNVEVNFSGEVDRTDVYVTKDGRYMILGSLLDLSKPLPKPNYQSQSAGSTGTNKDYGKVEKPKVLLFVMSFCPYGQQAERGMFPVVKLLKDKIDFSLHYVIYGPEYYNNDSRYCMEGLCSMHGVDELKEDIRQMCIIKYYPDSYIDYISEIDNNCNYKNVESCWKGVAQKFGIDTEKIENCASSEGIEMAKNDKQIGDRYGVEGSPTIFINDVEYSGGRSPEDFKSAICSSFSSEPSECAQKLSSSSSTVSGSCG